MTYPKAKYVYPVIIGIYSCLELVAANIAQMRVQDGYRALIVSFVLTFLVYLFVLSRVRDRDKAAAFAALLMLYFFSYGHIFDWMKGWIISGVVIGRHRFLFPILTSIFTFISWKLLTTKRDLISFSRSAYYACLLLLLFPLVQIGYTLGQRALQSHSSDFSENSILQFSGLGMSNRPDIYYIIVDGYTRADMLEKYYEYDNSRFISQLEELGFYVVSCAQSNYAMTDLSLYSSLNMEYLTQPQIANEEEVTQKILNNQVVYQLQDAGYQIVSIESGIWFTEWTDADIYISQDSNALNHGLFQENLNDFEVLYIRTTLLRLLDEANTVWLAPLLSEPRRDEARNTIFIFDQLETISLLPSPKFVFVHILAPHAVPFLFDRQGQFVISDNEIPGYGDEIHYLNSRIIPVVKHIIDNSASVPVIILQGDHGLGSESRMAILSAIYADDRILGEVYPTMTPVNTFRILLNAYLGNMNSLLPDISYYSLYEDKYNLSEVSYPCFP